uniref:Uncharacterized protein n=1 Tax=Rhizophora mucronata TaxID=61149 RepID=A0A2P2MIC1_RHIMU
MHIMATIVNYQQNSESSLMLEQIFLGISKNQLTATNFRIQPILSQLINAKEIEHV